MAFSYFDQLQNPSKFVGFEPMMAFNGITTRLYSEIARENLKLTNELMQNGMEHIQSLSHARGIEEVLSLQSKCMAKTTPQIIHHVQHLLDTLIQGANDYSKLFEKGAEKASQHFEKGMEKATAHQEKFIRDIKDKTEKR